MLGQDRFQRGQIHGGHSQAPAFFIIVIIATAGGGARVSHRCQVHFHVKVEEVNVPLEEC